MEVEGGASLDKLALLRDVTEGRDEEGESKEKDGEFRKLQRKYSG
jgi:hypothetical protein